MKITVIGSGYVGTTTAIVLAHIGHNVIAYDVDANKVKLLSGGKLPFLEPGLEELLLEQLNSGRISFTADASESITNSDILLIAVGTPSSASGAADLSYIEQVLATIAKHINGPKIIVTKSTVPFGTNRWIKQQLNEKIGGSYPIEVISNPEFLREGVALHDSLHPSRTVIGGEDQAAIQTVKDMYEPLNSAVLICNYETAEMIKYASNGFLAAKISFINEMARLADEIGADIERVADGMGMDPRISPHHMQAGLGYGGSCFPKDVNELLYSARKRSIPLKLLQRVKHINNTQIDWFIDRMESQLPLKGKRLLVLGITFKENTDDQRESPSIRLIERLLNKGVQEIRIIDPTIADKHQVKWMIGDDDRHYEPVHVLTDKTEAAAGVHAVLITTPWPEFASYPWKEWAGQAEAAYLFDGRNFLNPALMSSFGWHYRGVARGRRS